MNNGLVNFLMAKHRISRERAQKRAEWIVSQQALRAAAKKIKLASAQGLLPFDGEVSEEAVSKFEPTEELPF